MTSTDRYSALEAHAPSCQRDSEQEAEREGEQDTTAIGEERTSRQDLQERLRIERAVDDAAEVARSRRTSSSPARSPRRSRRRTSPCRCRLEDAPSLIRVNVSLLRVVAERRLEHDGGVEALRTDRLAAADRHLVARQLRVERRTSSLPLTQRVARRRAVIAPSEFDAAPAPVASGFSPSGVADVRLARSPGRQGRARACCSSSRSSVIEYAAPLAPRRASSAGSPGSLRPSTRTCPVE